MIYIRVADLNIKIDNRYGYLDRHCADYMIDATDDVDISVSVTEEEIDGEIAISDVRVSRGYAESICAYRTICEQLPQRFNGFLLHGALLEYGGKGYIFSARSGTGKTTHINLWKEAFGDAVTVVNGDKPILRETEDGFIAYGTPWCGKEGYSNNSSVLLSSICFVERAETNSIERISPSDAVSRIFSQILMPNDVEAFDAVSSLLDSLLTRVPSYLLKCNMNVDAAVVAYNGMNQKKG